MASTIALANVVLIDNFPGVPDTMAPVPADGFMGARHFNVTTAALYDVGTKIQVWDTVTGGPVTLCYLQNANLGTGPKATVAGMLLAPHTTQFAVSADPDDTPVFAITRGQVAVALGVVAVSSYAFFWIGGVCPADTRYFSSSLAAVNAITNGSVVLASPMMLVDETEDLGFKIHAGDVVACGYSKLDDV